MSHPAYEQVVQHLVAKSLTPTQTWLESVLATQKPTTPLPALKQTVLFRLLASDFTQSLSKNGASSLPQDVLNPEAKSRLLAGPVPVQVLDVNDMGRSRWSQVEALEAHERGEMTKGREIIRRVASEDTLDATEAANSQSSGPCRVLLQDARGLRIYGIEAGSVDGLSASMSIGAKIVLHDFTVARGVVLLDAASTTVLGSKVNDWDKEWRATRKQRLLAELEAKE